MARKECPECTPKKHTYYKHRLFQVCMALFVIVFATFLFPELVPLRYALYDYAELIWWAILLGMVIGGIIDHLVPRKYISKYLTKGEKKTIGYAVILGFLMSACSHGILAISMELYKKGASIPAVIAFLMASPWANLPITLLLFSFFGYKGFFLVGSAILIAVITGIIYQALERAKILDTHKFKAEKYEEFSLLGDMRTRLRNYKFTGANLSRDTKGVLRGSWSLTKMVLWWILIGMLFASIARAYIPHDIFVTYMGPTFLGLIVTLALATVIEVCSEGSAPLAFEIFSQTKAFGNSFTFLMAGVATDYTEIGLISSNIGKRSAILLPIITVPQILVLGYLFNLIL